MTVNAKDIIIVIENVIQGYAYGLTLYASPVRSNSNRINCWKIYTPKQQSLNLINNVPFSCLFKFAIRIDNIINNATPNDAQKNRDSVGIAVLNNLATKEFTPPLVDKAHLC